MLNQSTSFVVETQMSSKGTIFVTLAVLSIHVSLVWSQCNVCMGATSMACVSENQYKFCVHNIPTGFVKSCPKNYICTASKNVICRPKSAVLKPPCRNCNVCNNNRIFACTGVHTYSLCLNTSTVSSLTGSCGASLVCNWKLPEICGDPTTGTTATCPTDSGSVTSTTPSLTTPATPLTYPQSFCQQMRINGRFSIPLEMDNTCKRYIYCFLTTSSTWSGQIYTCAGSTYFDPDSRFCVVPLPTGCV